MAKFTFKLQAVLNQREREEESRQRDLAKLLSENNLMENELRGNQQDISDDKHQMKEDLIGQVDVDRVRQHAMHTGQVTLRAQELVMRLYNLHNKIEQARELLLESTKARKAVELLRDQQFAAWQKEQAKKEQMELDEIAQRNHHNEKGAGK